MEEMGSDDPAVDPLAIPALYPHKESTAVPAIVLDVDGEVFELRPGESGGTNYRWLTGPNPDYGFGSSRRLDSSLDDHCNSTRNFLAQVDPMTGYIEDD